MPEFDDFLVLVIEDDEDTRSNLRDLLELDGVRVETAATVAEAFRRDNWSEVAAVILDRKLPDGAAEEVLPRLKQAAPHAAVMVVTGYADLNGVIAALREGADEYLLKPVNPDRLRASLQRVIKLKRAEERALQAERLAAIGQVMAGIAHESRNALQRSLACLEMLALEIEDRPEALDLLRRAQLAQDHLHKLFEEVRNYAAPIKLDRSECQLAEVWHEAWNLLSQQRAGRVAELREIRHGCDLLMRVDHFRLVQVFRNLLENSLAACRDPVNIEIECAESTLSGAPAVQISVHDNGPGLKPEQKKRVFEPFYTTKTQGTGLGMAIAQRIVDAHGGTLRVGEGRHQGAEFLLTLPRP